MKATMQDVAKEAAVDKATVSRVLKGDHRISEKTKIKVMEAVRTLNYRLDRNARNLSTNRSGFIGIVFKDLNVSWTSGFIAGLDRAMANSEYDILIKCTDGDPRRSAREFGKLCDRGAEAIVWGDGANLPADISVPTVTLGFKKEGAISIMAESGEFRPTFETGALVGRLIIKIITGKPVPMREVIIKGADDECL
ncbi:MAG: LacI family DNA-binding transcriptional regulator [Synergistaceae bacterium]